VDDRPHAAPVLVADLVEGQALLGVEADPQAPLLPAHLVAVDREARALGLRDLDGLDVVAQAGEAGHVVLARHQVRRVVAGLRRDRDDAVVDDADDLHRVEVDLGDEPLDRARIAVLAGLGAHPRERAAEAPLRRVVLGAGVRGGPRVEHREREVLDAALAHRLLPALVLEHDLLGRHELLFADRRLDAGAPLGADDLAVGERDDRLEHAHPATLAHDDLGLARHGGPGLPRMERLLGRLVKHDEDEAGLLVEPEFVAQDGGRGGDLVGRQRFERMGGRRLDGGRGGIHRVGLLSSDDGWRRRRPYRSACPASRSRCEAQHRLDRRSTPVRPDDEISCAIADARLRCRAMDVVRLIDGVEGSLSSRVARVLAALGPECTVVRFTYWYTGRPPVHEAIVRR
jgi:hypothetical protein